MIPRRTLILTGNGKGKTTSAIGMVVRAVGHGQAVAFIQFLKANDAIGEIAGLQFLPNVSFHQLGRGFVPKPSHPKFSEHQHAATEAWSFAKSTILAQSHQLVILDEIFGALHHGWIPESELIDLITGPQRPHTLILTGRNAPPSIIAHADTVSEVACIKHAYQQGTKSQKGVEW